MGRRIGTYGVLLALAVGGCTPRELAWLVPRASVGLAVRTHEGQLASAGFVTLTTPLAPPLRAARPLSPGRPVRLLGQAMPCRVPEACRWEGRARMGTVADLADELATGTP